ncbi:MAG: ABC transporter ATP-binding protein, partial [Candidatus Omnitrophica bacterium]|nr:ABC transporter ATP-binding protein [Candidatus Omnitrophota bacterium]
MAETVIELKNIAKKYCFSLAKQSLLNNVLSFFKKALPKTDVWALKDINFSVEKGQILGIIGENASGKTTILRIISRITVPTLGQVMVKGKVAGLLDLGAGFHPELTGRENIYLDAALYGLNKTQTDALLLEIIEFSGLEDLVDAQVKTYSQGMLVRLGFSVAVHVDPDIFLIDDSLAVGDEEFQRKCLSKILELKEHGKTIIVVSHDLDSISRICERGILLKSGRIVKDDSMHKVIIRYVEAVGDKDSIVAIDKGKLSVIFNGGRIILLWNGKPLTKNFGGYISVQVMDKWILSWKARWKVIEKSADYFKVQGSWDNYGLNICIEVYLNNECSISWKSIIEGSGNADAREIIIGLMLDGIYNHYFDNYRMKQIEKRHYKSSRWYDIYRTDEQNAALILKTDDELPAVVISFKKNNIEGFQLIQKTDSNLDASVAQIHMILSESMKRNDSRIQTVYCEADIEVAQEERIEQIIIKQRRKKSIEQGLLRLELEGKSLHVFFDDRRLTGRKGLQFGFSYQEKYFNIFDEEWNFEKKDAQSMSISSWLKDNKIKTKLNIIMENNKICWQFDVKEDKSVAVGIESVEVNLFAVEKYENYFSLEESGHFSNVIGFNNKTEIRNSLEAVIGLRGEDPNLPWLISEYGINTKVQLFDMQKEAGGRLIRAWVKESNSIKGSIFVFKEKKNIDNYLLEQRKNLQKSKVLSNDILMLSFSDNRIRLFWKGIEVTAENGLSSSIFFNGCWYESEINDKQIVENGNKL